jgi:hypothetical protein
MVVLPFSKDDFIEDDKWKDFISNLLQVYDVQGNLAEDIKTLADTDLKEYEKISLENSITPTGRSYTLTVVKPELTTIINIITTERDPEVHLSFIATGTEQDTSATTVLKPSVGEDSWKDYNRIDTWKRLLSFNS